VNYLIDTNVISEVRKGARCDPYVSAWLSSIKDEDVYLSVLVLGETRRGIERARRSDPARARALDTWLSTIKQSYGDCILPIDQMVADEWGSMSATRLAATVDSLLAATAKVHRMTLATRNVADVAGLGADVLNPCEPADHPTLILHRLFK
jgi:predicted nucleic acid-binding protein